MHIINNTNLYFHEYNYKKCSQESRFNIKPKSGDFGPYVSFFIICDKIAIKFLRSFSNFGHLHYIFKIGRIKFHEYILNITCERIACAPSHLWQTNAPREQVRFGVKIVPTC